MLLVKKITLKKIKALTIKTFCSALFLSGVQYAAAQDNSPYSRYGLGDVAPNNNIVNRGMGGVSAAYTNPLSINFNNPASYSGFQTWVEGVSKKLQSGRVVLDVGINVDSRTLREPNEAAKFTSTNAAFSYIQVGMPLRRNWGLSFGIRPVSRINYKIIKSEKLLDPITGLNIDSANTEFSGNGGAFLPTIGTGIAIKNFSIGVNVGYLFGRKENTTKRALFNDTVSYNASNHTTRATFGNIYFNGGAQYKIKINNRSNLNLGVSGGLEQKLKAQRTVLRETFIRDVNSGDIPIDSVYERTEDNGEIVYPATYTVGFLFDQNFGNGGTWGVGVDYVKTNWSNYRFFNTADAVQDNWQIRVGTQFRPEPTRRYFSNVVYRAGFFTGPDYVNAGGELPVVGASIGLGLPLANYSAIARNQFTLINLGLEYVKRGNNDNPLKENLFRVSLGLNFSDIWFNKKKYD